MIEMSLVQLFTLIISIVIGTGILNLPTNIAAIASQDAWLATLFGGLVTLGILNFGLFLLNRHPGENILDIGTTLTGNIGGKVIGALFFLKFLLVCSIILRVTVDFISTWILQQTPIEILMLSILLMTLYLVSCGLKTVIKFNEITALLLLPFAIVIVLPFKEWNYLNLLPVFQESLPVYAKATLQSLYAYLGFEIIFFFLPLVKVKFKKAVITANLTVFFIIGIYTMMVASTILAFGVKGLQNSVYISLRYIGLLQIAIVERVEFAFMYFWIFALFSTFSLSFYLSYMSLRHVIKFKSTSLLPIALLLLAIRYISLIPQNVAEVGEVANIAGTANLVLVMSVLILLTLISLIRGKVKKGGRS